MNATIQVMPAAEYHRDPAPKPSLSSSIAQLLIAESPLHAYAAHPRLGNFQRESARRSEIGSVAHKIALGAGADVVIIQARDYRTKAAQEQRDSAIAAGSIPILESDYADAESLATPLAAAAAEYMGMHIADCLTERVILWQDEGGGWRRAMLDLLAPDYRRMCDLKTTQASVSADACKRRLYEGYHIQRAFHERGVDALDPAGVGLRRFGFIFAEQSPPYAVGPPMELSEAGLELGRKQVVRACKIWDECLSSGKWPGYSRDVSVAEPPVWELQRQMEEEA